MFQFIFERRVRTSSDALVSILILVEGGQGAVFFNSSMGLCAMFTFI